MIRNHTSQTFWILVACLFTHRLAMAGYLEFPAAEIVSIAPADRAESPRILVNWNLPANLDMRFVDAAVISIKLEKEGTKQLGVQLHPLTSAWSAQNASWTAGWTKAGGDFDQEVASPALLTNQNAGAVSIDVYLSIREILANQRSNYGFIIVPERAEGVALKPIAANEGARLANSKLILAYREKK